MMTKQSEGTRQGRAGISRLFRTMTALALGAAVCLAAMMPVSAQAKAQTTQLEYLQVLVQLSGDTGQFSANSRPQDYVNWAHSKGLSPKSGWVPSAKVTRDLVTQTLSQLLGLSPGKNQDYTRALARLGITVPEEVSREALMGIVDQHLQPRLPMIRAQVSKGNGNSAGGGTPTPGTPVNRGGVGNATEEQVTICHNFRTISVSRRALETHLAHGDTLGPCPDGPTETVCHNGQTLVISRSALEEHLAHGDTVGPCVPTPTNNQ